MHKVDRAFGEKFLAAIDDFYGYGVHLLFNEWWQSAPQDAIDKYVAAIADHPEHGPLAAAAWMAPPFSLSHVADCAPGTLGAAWRTHMVENGLAEQLAVGYAALTDDFAASGKLNRLPAVLQYKVLRGYQTHDLHHVLTGYTTQPLHELALQAFQLAQMDYPYSAMTLSVIMGHATLVDPWLIQPAMDAITDGWALGRRAKSVQFIDFENHIHRPLADVRAEYGLTRDTPFAAMMPKVSELVAQELVVQEQMREQAAAGMIA
ncbi:Coq4 family protein [Sandarakinorhabdus sp.]|uniref:Coq4 family protein n=1 Tax=Sandarakinorhabdus sp. TaxID=1916663 RepID=UPI0035613F8D